MMDNIKDAIEAVHRRLLKGRGDAMKCCTNCYHSGKKDGFICDPDFPYHECKHHASASGRRLKDLWEPEPGMNISELV
jgi:hypothetical protein